jgi:acylphosphatase
MSQRRVAIVVSGSVQGVFFRSSLQDEAERLGVSGWVRNAADGSVEAQIQGSPEAVDEIIRFCRRGPSGASVENIDVRDLEVLAGERGFRVR